MAADPRNPLVEPVMIYGICFLTAWLAVVLGCARWLAHVQPKGRPTQEQLNRHHH